MRSNARLLVLSLLSAAGIAALSAAHAPDVTLGGVIKVRIAVTSQEAGAPVDVQATVAEGHFASGDRSDRTRTLRGRGEQSTVVELTHTGRVTLVSRGGAVRAVASYAAAPPGAQVSEAVWRRLQLVQVGTRVELQRAGSFVQVKPDGVAVRSAGAR